MWVKYCGAAGAAKIAIGESLSGRRPRRGAHRVPAGRRYGRMAEELDCGDEFLDCEDFDEVASDDEEAQLAAQLLEQL
eukprot:gene8879-biopygen4662